MERWQEELLAREQEESHVQRPSPPIPPRPVVKRERPNPWRQRFVIGTLGMLATLLVLRFAPVPFGVVKVDGNTGISAWDLTQTGLIPNPVNIMQISKEELARSLKKDLRVASVHMNYALPLTLEVHLEARQPVATVMTDYGYAELDANGQCVYINSVVGNKRLPILTGYKMGNLLLGDRVETKAVLAAISYIDHLSTDGKAVISEVNIGQENHFIAYTVDGISLQMDVDDKMGEKAKLTEEMLKDIKDKNLNVESIDLNLESPFMKMRQ